MIKKLEDGLSKLESDGVIQSHSQPGSLKIFFKLNTNHPIKKEPLSTFSPSSHDSPHSIQSPTQSTTPSSPLSSHLQYSPSGSLSPVKEKPRGKASRTTPRTPRKSSRKSTEKHEKYMNKSQEEESAESVSHTKSSHKKRIPKSLPEDDEEYETKGNKSSNARSNKKLRKIEMDELEDKLMQVWDTIVKHRHAAIFRYPVTKEEAADYDDIIEKRMDLETIKINIESGDISSPEDIWEALRLMFENARVYNGEESEIAFMAEALEKYARARISKVFPSFLPPDSHSTRKSKSKGKRKSIR